VSISQVKEDFSPPVLQCAEKSFQHTFSPIDNALKALCLRHFWRVEHEHGTRLSTGYRKGLRKKSLKNLWGIVGKYISLQQKPENET
jgi:hypothetical protein